MNFIAKRQPEDVHEWLVIATRDLAPSEQKRIWAEILAHHAESVAAHHATGLSQAEAENAALAELGDVYAAQKSFRKMYLLEKEERRLRGHLERSWALGFMNSCFGALICTVVAFYIFHYGQMNGQPPKFIELVGLTLAFTTLAVLPAVSTAVSKRVSVRKRVVLLMLTDWVNILGIYYMVLQPPTYWFVWAGFFGTICIFLNQLWVAVRLSRKIPPDWLQEVKD